MECWRLPLDLLGVDAGRSSVENRHHRFPALSLCLQLNPPAPSAILPSRKRKRKHLLRTGGSGAVSGTLAAPEMENSKMRIAYVTIYESSDIHSWSGSGFHIRSALTNRGFQILPIGNLKDKCYLITKAKQILYKTLFSKRYLRDREPFLLKSYACQVEKSLSSINCDAIFSPGTIPIAYLCTEKLLIFWADATFAGMINFYPGFKNLCSETIRDGNRMEQLALSKCRLAIYASEWASIRPIGFVFLSGIQRAIKLSICRQESI